MTALVSSNSTFLLNPSNNSSNTAGILLNARSHSSPSHPREPRQQSSFASSSSSASQTSHSQSLSSNEGEGPCRKIRFAPLPAPRREESSTVFYESDSDPPLDPSSGSTLLHCSQSPPSPRTSISTLQPDDSPSKSKSRTWGQKLLRPLLQPLLPTTTNGEESYSALFRISSRESTKLNTALSSDPYKGGEPLARRMSTGSRAISSTKETERSHIYRDGIPLSPVMSDGFASKGRKDGQRMLNGRVYGRRSSPTQNGKQAFYEPEFVEWGYGGMGSVTNNQARSRSGPDWAKLQSRGKVLGGGPGIDEEDDGSGMGWVRRRRAQREREEREREVLEKTIPDHTVTDIASSPQLNESKDYSRPPLPGDDSDQSSDSGEHVYRAVSVPALHHHHIRHHSHHKTGDGSGSATPTSAPPLSRANSSNSVPLFRTASSGSHSEILPTMSERREDAEISSESSEAGSISIDEEDEDDEIFTERESDDDDRDDAEGRITSRCAGVEKISRHKV